MTSKEFVAFMKGIAIGIEDTPTAEQWVVVMKNLMKIDDSEEKDATNLINEIQKEVGRVVKPLKKKFPGSPPDIFM
jgi:archaellum biogenesis ATPase FlaH